MPPLDALLLISSLLIIISVIAARVSHSFGLPALLLFLALGMFAGEEGPGKIVFNDHDPRVWPSCNVARRSVALRMRFRQK